MNNKLIPIYLYKNNEDDNDTYINYKFFIIHQENNNYIVAHEKFGICIKIDKDILNKSSIINYKERKDIINLLKKVVVVGDMIKIIPYNDYINNYFDQLYNEEYEYRRINNAIKIIQKYYLEAYYNPLYNLCKNRLENSFNNDLKMKNT